MEDSFQELIQFDQEHLIHPLHHPLDHKEPLVAVRGRGARIYDSEGRSYLDGLSGLWNVNVGHGRHELADAAAEQMKELAFFSAYVGSSNVPAIRLARRLLELSPGMDAVFFTSGGAEANESAFKTARFYWKVHGKPEKVKVISRFQSYHGVTLQAMSATYMGNYWKMFEPRVPGFIHISNCYEYRLRGTAGETPGQAAARELEEAILREGPDTVAAFVGEPIQGAGGVFYPTDDYWPRIREICTRHNVLLIADEVITGFCRTGRWFAMDHWKVQPDILTFAKGVTSGYIPLGGMLISSVVKDSLNSVKPSDRWMHAYTYSAHPVCCAVALKNLEIMEREQLCERTEKMGKLLRQRLQEAFGDHPNTGDIRAGKGLLAAVELVEDKASKRNFPPEKNVASRIQKGMMKRGVVTRTRPSGGADPAPGDIILFAPPLIISEAELDEFVGTARSAVQEVLGSV